VVLGALAALFSPPNLKPETRNLKLSLMQPLTRAQVREYDRRAIEELGVPGVVLMENAGRGAAEVAIQMLATRGGVKGAPVAVLCGGGNNGGDGYVIARHLHLAGAAVTIHAAVDAKSLKGDALVNATIADRIAVPSTPIRDADELACAAPLWHKSHLIVDALLGTGFVSAGRDAVRPHLAEVIRRCNRAHDEQLKRSLGPEVLAVDLPSGLDCDTGEPADATIVADVTVTFVGKKVGFEKPRAKGFLGRVVVVGIGV